MYVGEPTGGLAVDMGKYAYMLKQMQWEGYKRYWAPEVCKVM